MYCTAPLSPRKGRLISFHDDDDGETMAARLIRFSYSNLPRSEMQASHQVITSKYRRRNSLHLLTQWFRMQAGTASISRQHPLMIILRRGSWRPFWLFCHYSNITVIRTEVNKLNKISVKLTLMK